MTTTMIRTSFEAGDGAAGGGGAEFAILRGSGFVVFKSYVNDAVYRGWVGGECFAQQATLLALA